MFPLDLARLAALFRPSDASGAWGDWGGAEPGAARERKEAEEAIASFEVVNLEDRAAVVRYGRNGKNKRTRYAPADLSKRRVVIALHQPGVERTEARWRQTAHRVTAQRFIGPTGVRYMLHPLTTQLIATNRFNRSPWHCINFEVAGNFEGVDGSGRWWNPERMGKGRASEAQLAATRAEIRSVIDEVRMLGGEVEAIVPHIIAGRNSAGRPNRQICPGSRVWSEAGEWAGAELGLKVPAAGFRLGGLPVPESWHGPHWGRCTSFLG